MSELPDGWAEASIADLASPIEGAITDGPYGSSLKTSHYTAEGPRVIRLGNIRPGALDMSDEAHVSEAHFASLARHHVKGGDVVMAALGEPLGRACRVPDDIGPAMVKADCFRIRVADEIAPEFLVRWLNSVEARDQLVAQSHGLGRIRVNLMDVRRSPVPVPPLPEQRRIVAKLDRLSARSRGARDHLARTAKLAARTKQAILAAVFDECKSKDATRIANLLSEPVRNGLSIRGADEPPGVRSLRLSALRGTHANLSDVRFLPINDAQAASYLLREGDVLISRGNGNLGLVGIAAIVPKPDAPVIFPDTAFRVRFDGTVADSRWFALTWSAPQVRSQIEGRAKTTAGIWKISQGDLQAIELPRVQLDKQREIVRRISSAFARIDRLAAEATRAAYLLDRLDERLLRRAFRGELVPQDPADEPASALLDRIRAARGVASPRGRERPRATRA